MQMAVDVAGFDAGEADQLRRAMGSKRSTAKMEQLRERLYEGMARQTASPARPPTGSTSGCWRSPTSASPRATRSASPPWSSLRPGSSCYHPAAFCAALLRAQPMGFYSPQSLVADARRHGVTVRRPDINTSSAHADLEPGPDGRPAVRLGTGRDPDHRRRTGRASSSAPGKRPASGSPTWTS